MGQHRDITPPRIDHRVIQSGPISLAPFVKPLFEEAVVTSGGRLVEVGPDTRGLIWLSEKDAGDLMAVLVEYPTIEWVQLPWAGVDAFSTVLAYVATLPEHQRPVVTSAKGSYSEPVAEHALALLLGCMRELPSKARDAFWQPERTGLSAFGRHIVVVGAGGVSQNFLELVAPFRPTITVVRRQKVPVIGAHETITPEEFHDVLPHADAVVIAAAATDSTRHLVGERELALMPAHSVVVNVARETRDPASHTGETVPRLFQKFRTRIPPRLEGIEHRVPVVGPSNEFRVHKVVDDSVLKIVHRVGDIVGKIHDLGLNTQRSARRPCPDPLKHVAVVFIKAKLFSARAVRLR